MASSAQPLHGSPPIKSEAPPTGPRLDSERFQWDSLLLLAPSVILLGGLFFLPVIYAFYLGFTNLDLIGPTAQSYHFTGTDNLQTLAHDSVFPQSLFLTFIFVIGSGVIGVVV